MLRSSGAMRATGQSRECAPSSASSSSVSVDHAAHGGDRVVVGGVALAQLVTHDELLHGERRHLTLVEEEDGVAARLLAARCPLRHRPSRAPAQAGSMAKSGWPYCTVAPSSTRISRTMPSMSATSSFIIFIISRMQSV